MIISTSNNRVVKNTLILYIRMFITMGIGIWTSRIVLNALGFTDQGLYNLVGGFVSFLSIITDSINTSFSRFLTYQIGLKDHNKVNIVFRNATTVQWILALIILLLAETVGLWFVYNKMIIPADRMHAVLIVYQFSVFSFVLELVSSASSALIIAYEKMHIFAGVAIVNSICKFAIAMIIAHSDTDRLILYAFLLALLSLFVRLFYTIYCRRSFSFIKLGFSLNKDVFTPIFSFAGWNSIGSSAAIIQRSGTSILLNLFGGPIANTINGIAHTANSLATLFVNGFTTAYNPQIIKKYASGDYRELIVFIHRCSKFTYCLMLIMAVPIIFNMGPLMVLWLKKIPDGTVIFGRLIIIYSLIECICRPLSTANLAAGKIRNYQIVVGGILLLTIPISYVFLKSGLPIWFSYIAIIITSIGALIARMMMLRGSIPGWSSRIFLVDTVLHCSMATGVSILVPYIMYFIMPCSTWSVLVQCFAGIVWSSLCVFFVACNSKERIVLYNMLIILLRRLKIVKHV